MNLILYFMSFCSSLNILIIWVYYETVPKFNFMALKFELTGSLSELQTELQVKPFRFILCGVVSLY